MERLKTLREAGTPSEKRTPPTREESDPDEILGLARNIERMARSLQQVEANYRNMVEDQVDLICRYRPDGRITFANGAYARAFAKKRQELNGELFPFYSSGVAIGDGPFTFERELVLPDNRRRWLLWIQRPIGDANGIVEYQAVGHDITERKEAEAALIKAKDAAESADRAKSEFLAIVSHELRTPINGVIGFAKLLTESPLNPEQREFVTMIQTGGSALERLIADILDLSRIEAGNIEIEKNPVALHQCIAESCAVFAPKAREAGLILESKIESGVPALVTGDATRISQILHNLVGNALKFTDRGRITVTVTCARGEPLAEGGKHRELRVFFAIADTGIGLPADKITGRLISSVRSTPRLSSVGSGTGLGWSSPNVSAN